MYPALRYTQLLHKNDPVMVISGLFQFQILVVVAHLLFSLIVM